MDEIVNETVAGINETIANGTGRRPATPEGMAVAYSSLFLMAVIPIFIGSFRSVKYHKKVLETEEQPETISHKDAAMFPLYASAALVGLYVFFKIFSKEYINLLLATYFFFLGVFALAHILSPLLSQLIPASFPNMQYHLVLRQGESNKVEDLIDHKFDRKDLITVGLCSVLGVWYLLKKHWLANNIFGLAFSINGIEFILLNKVATGGILLGGLFVYDVFWVFGTDVMVSVAKSFEAPIKLVFPQDLLEKGLAADNFAMLGLGDIVIPGILVALLLRFDISRKPDQRIYFYSCFFAYAAGLLTTIVVMHVTNHAQPALLYLVPACLGTPMVVALLRSELSALLSYEDHPTKETPATVADGSTAAGEANHAAKDKEQ